MSSPAHRIGLFGGTFDPPHNAHVVAAVAARHQLDLDRVLMVVAGDPWQKAGQVEADANERLAMARLACDGLDGVEVSAIEVERGGATYTIDTVEALRATEPAPSEIVLILGADAVAGLDSWHRADELAAMVSIGAMPRWSDDDKPIEIVESAHWRIVELQMPRLDIASHEVRAAVARGAPIDGVVPPAVVRYVRTHRLYTRM